MSTPGKKYQNELIVSILFMCLILCISSKGFAYPKQQPKYFYITLRNGQGGFSDSRSDLGELGGGQLGIDIHSLKYPVAISYIGEYYTNSPEPTHNYEIAGSGSLNLYYMDRPFSNQRFKIFAGGGLGILSVPKSEENFEEYINAWFINLEAGIEYRLIWKFGVYGLTKYLYSYKEKDNTSFVDFNEFIFMIGLSLTFGI